MPDLLLELFSEEIPARMQPQAAADLARMMKDGLKAHGLEAGDGKPYATPRRLTLHMTGLPDRSPDVSEEKKGPRVGAPDQAIQGFLKSAGLSSIDQAEVQSDKKGDFYIARIARAGRPVAEIIPTLVRNVIWSFPWPKSMRWGAKGGFGEGAFGAGSFGSNELRWVRPLRSILCVLDQEPLVFRVAGLESGNRTCGHRFLSKGTFAVSGFDDYLEKLEDAHVVLDPEFRKRTILDHAREAADEHGGSLVEDEALVAENAGLTEWPVPLVGTFDEDFLDMPPEVLSTAMKAHQKCFSVRGTGDSLTNRFVLVANLDAKDGGKAIVEGNERVIRARLADAKFFWDQDRQTLLQDRVLKLKEITFHEKLGTQYERTKRIMALSRELAPIVGADADEAERAAILAKADLVTGMVGEFPELQGLMGRYYALDQGELPEVANAVASHYKPLGPNDEVPREPVSMALALADKLDMLVGFWAIGEKPTGSKDPYALRRAALGIIRIVLENRTLIPMRLVLEAHLLRWLAQVQVFELSQAFVAYDNSEANEDLLRLARAARNTEVVAALISPTTQRFEEIQRLHPQGFDPDRTKDDWIDRVDDFTKWYMRVEEFRSGRRDTEALRDIDTLGQPLALWAAGVRDDLLVFLADRLKVYLRDRGARYDLIDAVFALPGQDDLLLIVRRVEALGKFLGTDDGANLLAGVKRASNILRIEEKKDGASYVDAPDPALFAQDEERALADAIDSATDEARRAIEAEDFAAAMRALAGLRAPVDAFFDKVTVNASDPALRGNRLKLLNQIRAATREVADFSKIGG